MTERSVVASLILAAALLLATPLHAQEMWKGVAKQNSGAQNYTVVITLSGNGGETDYPELKCGGTLTRVGQSGAYSFYVEKIIRKGTGCIDGAVTLVESNGAMSWGWVGAYNGQTYVAWSMLAKQ